VYLGQAWWTWLAFRTAPVFLFGDADSPKTVVTNDFRTRAQPEPTLSVSRMRRIPGRMMSDDCGQSIAEYAMMAAVMITLVIGVLASVGVHAAQIFFSVKRVLR